MEISLRFVSDADYGRGCITHLFLLPDNTMRKYLTYIFLTTLLVVLSSCTQIILKMQGGHLPRIENAETIESTLEKYNLSDSNNYIICDSSSYFKILKEITSLPEIMFFNDLGEKMEIRKQGTCTAGVGVLIDSIQDYTVPDTSIYSPFHQIDSLLYHLRTLEGEVINKSTIKEADYFVVIFWAKFIGKLNRTKVKQWELALQAKKNLKIEVLKVNCDVQEMWGLNEKKEKKKS
ncbi:MAG: hypothetical protein KAT48_12820 [Bacteroidales bacterium]|nr:hypothetical protein [Bacteroidales bacterium]